MACMERTIALLDDGVLAPVAVAESAVETCRAQAPMEINDQNLRAAVDRTRAEVIEIFSHRVQRRESSVKRGRLQSSDSAGGPQQSAGGPERAPSLETGSPSRP